MDHAHVTTHENTFCEKGGKKGGKAVEVIMSLRRCTKVAEAYERATRHLRVRSRDEIDVYSEDEDTRDEGDVHRDRDNSSGSGAIGSRAGSPRKRQHQAPNPMCVSPSPRPIPASSMPRKQVVVEEIIVPCLKSVTILKVGEPWHKLILDGQKSLLIRPVPNVDIVPGTTGGAAARSLRAIHLISFLHAHRLPAAP